MLKEISEDLNSIKQVQSEMKDTLIEKRTIYRETTVEWMKLRIKSMVWNIKVKNNQPEQQEEKRIQKK